MLHRLNSEVFFEGFGTFEISSGLVYSLFMLRFFSDLTAGYFIYLFIYLIWGAMPSNAQELLLVGLSFLAVLIPPYGMLGIELRLAAYKAGILTAVLLLWSF